MVLAVTTWNSAVPGFGDPESFWKLLYNEKNLLHNAVRLLRHKVNSSMVRLCCITVVNILIAICCTCYSYFEHSVAHGQSMRLCRLIAFASGWRLDPRLRETGQQVFQGE
jgi:hypothetical protein